MTTGIYCLYFDGLDEVYVGQAVNIERRFLRHKSNLNSEKIRNKKSKNYKIYKAYINYGIPKYCVLEVCLIDQLNIKECSWIEELDTINNGLNICSGGSSGRGPHNGSSVYSMTQILQVLELLQSSSNTYERIKNITKVPKSCISGIVNGTVHKWLEEAYPDKYACMIEVSKDRNLLSHELGHIKLSASEVGITYPVLLHTDGKEYIVTNLRAFAKEHDLDGGNLIKVMDGKWKSCKGFIVKTPGDKIHRDPKCYGRLVSPEGQISEDIFNIKAFAERHNLCPSSLGKVLREAKPTYKGWTKHKG